MAGWGQSEKCHWQGDVCEADDTAMTGFSGQEVSASLVADGARWPWPREPAERVEATWHSRAGKSNLNNNTWGWQKDLPGVHAFLWKGRSRESLTPFPEDFWQSYRHLLLERNHPYRIQFHLGGEWTSCVDQNVPLDFPRVTEKPE